MNVKSLKSVVPLVKDTVNEWLDDRAMSLAASLAFYTVLSLAPLLILAVTVAGMFFGEAAARGEITHQLQTFLGPDAGSAIEAILAHTKEPHANLIGTLIALVVLFFGASGVFTELQESLNQIWQVKPKPGAGLKGLIRARAFSFAMVLAVAFLLLVSFLLSAAINIVGHVVDSGLPGGVALWAAVNAVISFAVITLLFALIFKVVPDAKIRWRDVWYGAAFTALLFVIGKALISLYLGKAGVGSPYGAAGSLVVLVVWVYYSAQILFLGAEFTQVYARSFGVSIEPDDHAVSTRRSALPPETAAVRAAREAREVAARPPAHRDPMPSVR
ncbi:MAG TPA: YihY/virulence factor BrkB family protein [Polyangiaceae bacterium]|jgi:membrane protein|nr:YihY/virulence factor BrkB family protein [Polyangiaceae bacterium]